MSENKQNAITPTELLAAGEDTAPPDELQEWLDELAKRDAERLAGHLALIDQRGAKTHRKPHLENGTVQGMVTPDKAVMAQITEETAGQVRYFPADLSKLTGGMVGENRFYAAVTEPLCTELIERFPDKSLALRGISTSINGTQYPEHMGVLQDITETSDMGTEKPGEAFNVAGLNRDNFNSIHRVNQYAMGAGMRRMEAGDTPAAEATFPAILVYDADKLVSVPGGAWTVAFKEGVEPKDALLAAYVVDCPDYLHR